MADERADRIYKRKRLTIQPSGATVDLPVLYKSAFKTMADKAQATEIYFDNSYRSMRKVHTHRIDAGGGDYVDVERIDSFYVKTMAEQAQQREWVMRNTDPPPIQSDGSDSPAHEKKHYVRYYSEDRAAYIDVELIDESLVKCMQEQAQEYHLYMLHPEPGAVIDDATVPYVVTEGYCDPDLPLADDDSSNGIDPPYRLDPWQNVIGISATPPSVSFRITNDSFSGTTTGTSASGTAMTDPNPSPPPGLPAGEMYDGSYINGFTMSATSAAQLFGAPGAGPEVSLSGASFSFSPWSYSLRQGWNNGSTIPAPGVLQHCDPGSGQISGPPLVVNGKTIAGYTSALSFTLTVSACPFLGGPVSFTDLPPVPEPHDNWWNYTGAAILIDNTISAFGSYTLTVSSTPFDIDGHLYRAVGLATVHVNVPPFGTIVAGSAQPGTSVSIYVVPA